MGVVFENFSNFQFGKFFFSKKTRVTLFCTYHSIPPHTTAYHSILQHTTAYHNIPLKYHFFALYHTINTISKEFIRSQTNEIDISVFFHSIPRVRLRVLLQFLVK